MSISALGSNSAYHSVNATDAGANRSGSGSVTLSKEAQSVAELASKGITVFTIHDGARVHQDLLNGTPGPAGSQRGGMGGAITYSDFDAVMRQLGATQAQADQLKQSFDADGDHSISNDELLRGLAATSGPRGSGPDAQLLLGLMDKGGNGDRVVQQGEFLSVETMLAHAQKKLS